MRPRPRGKLTAILTLSISARLAPARLRIRLSPDNPDETEKIEKPLTWSVSTWKMRCEPHRQRGEGNHELKG
jgi:hypothetical protein